MSIVAPALTSYLVVPNQLQPAQSDMSAPGCSKRVNIMTLRSLAFSGEIITSRI